MSRYAPPSTANNSGKPAEQWLHESPALQAISVSRQPLVKLQQALDLIGQQLKVPVKLTASRLENDTLTIAVPSAALAAKYKQLVPSLINALEREAAKTGVKISRIGFRPQPELFAPTPIKRTVGAVPRDSVDALERLEQASDNPALKLALARLVKRQRGLR